MHNGFISKLRQKSFTDILVYIEDRLADVANRLLFFLVLKKEKRFNANLKDMHITFDFNDKISETVNESEIYIANQYMLHKFDLLGSGWVNNNYPVGFTPDEWIQRIVPIEYSDKAKQLCCMIYKCNSRYNFIDWHRDYKNNYRYDSRSPSEKIRIEKNAAQDIKIPWELARCQHMPYMAKLYYLTKDKKYLEEIRNEILDFILFNPIGYGVNWKCTMDVGIRITNWIIAIAICQPSDGNHVLDKNFFSVFYKSVVEHCVFIRYHLENKRKYRGNHYFADIVGLLFSSAFLEESQWSKATLEFSTKELLRSIDEQFYEDGGNFEASIPYHKFTLEMALYGLMLLQYLSGKKNRVVIKTLYGKENELNKCLLKLEKAISFLMDGVKPNGDIYQLGDNDSGHLLRFNHYGAFLDANEYINKYENINDCEDVICWDENELSAKETILLAKTIYKEESDGSFFSCFVNSMIANGRFKWPDMPEKQIPMVDKKCSKSGKLLFFLLKHEFVFEHEIDMSKLKIIYYPKFGLYGCKSEEFFLGISAGGNGQNGRGGHAHNDKLSFELQVHGKDMVTDPGTYVYTESLKYRNMFRSTKAHYIPYLSEEQNPIGKDCFSLAEKSKCKLLNLSISEMEFECIYGTHCHVRKFIIKKHKLIILDMSSEEITPIIPFRYYSNGYGKLIKK